MSKPRKAFATSPHNLPFVNRTIAEVEADRNRVIYERHHGWEKASLSQLAAIFGISSYEVGRICRDPANALRDQNAPRPDRDGGKTNPVSNHIHNGAE